MLDAVASLNGRAFDNDPVLAYMLLDMSQDKRLAYLPKYWSKLIKAAVLNDGIITEADGWKSASVMVPPGRSVDNIWTLLPAGVLAVLWRIGIPGLRVRETRNVYCNELANWIDCYSGCSLSSYRRQRRRKEKASGAKSGTITSLALRLTMSIGERVIAPGCSGVLLFAHVPHRTCQGHHAEAPAYRQEGEPSDLA